MEQNQMVETVAIEEVAETSKKVLSKEVLIKAGIGVGAAALVTGVAVVVIRKNKDKIKNFFSKKRSKKEYTDNVIELDDIDEDKSLNTLFE